MTGTQPTVVLESPAPARRRRRGWIAAVVVAVLLVAAVAVAEVVARSAATGAVRDRVVQALRLPASADVAVDLGGGSILWQAATGSVDRLSVRVAALPLGPLTGSATLDAAGVPLDGSRPVRSLRVLVSVPGSEVGKLADSLSGLPVESIALQGSAIRIATTLDLLVVRVPVQVDLAPTATGTGVAFEPTAISVDGQPLSVQGLRDLPGVGALAGQLLGSREFCVADALPRALSVSDVRVAGDRLDVTLDGSGAALGGAAFAETGVCAG